MILYTMQDREVLDILEAQGIVYPDVRKEYEGFEKAYEWMRSKMFSKGILAKRHYGMFWAHSAMKDMEYLEGGDLLILNIPDHLILPSDHCDWHCVLNGGPIVQDSPEFEEEYDRLCLKDNHNELIKSWDNCLGTIQNGQVKGNPLFHTETTVWQMTFPSISKDQVIEIKRDWVGSMCRAD